ncbi:MAG: helix-turn-helix transcriptional regulator [Bacteroidota bacterium]
MSKTLDLVERIQAILEEKGMSQKDLALALGKSPSEISRWMTGLHNFEVKTLVKLEQALGVELFLVAGGEKFAAAARSAVAASQPAGFADLSAEQQAQVVDFIDFLKQRSLTEAKLAKMPRRYKMPEPELQPLALASEPPAPEYGKKKEK